MFMRAQFDYDPPKGRSDSLQGGCGTEVCYWGHYLQIINKDDSNWWQRRVEDLLKESAGLIPSPELRECEWQVWISLLQAKL